MTELMSTATLKARSDVDPRFCWDLSSLYADDAAWESDFKELSNSNLPRCLRKH